jgi:hypothetical protein
MTSRFFEEAQRDQRWQAPHKSPSVSYFVVLAKPAHFAPKQWSAAGRALSLTRDLSRPGRRFFEVKTSLAVA